MNLHIESRDDEDYVAYIEDIGKKIYLKRPSGSLYHFYSLGEIKHVFGDRKFDHVWLQHVTTTHDLAGIHVFPDTPDIPLHW